ncbi:hypothetical protein [Pasteurella sp. PK-2025]|uniref:hypothetical protein n=1 Tax=Pasteurella sp. PK-2025 TaxID=3413133 RepID=UPI003C775700
MSVMIINDTTLATIAMYADIYDVSVYNNGKTYRARDFSPIQIMHWLYDCNLKSFKARYKEESELSILRYRPQTCSAVQVIKLCKYVAYQCCEMPGWRSSLQKEFLDALKEQAIYNLEGYEEAEWGF